MAHSFIFAACFFVSMTQPASCQLQKGKCKELFINDNIKINCEIPLVNLSSIQYEFYLSEDDSRTLEASITWDPPPGYDTFAVRLAEERFADVPKDDNFFLRCDLIDLFNVGMNSQERHQVVTQMPFNKTVNFGFTYWINIFTVSTSPAPARRSYIGNDCPTLLTYDCFNVTRDFNFCRNQPILEVSAPVDPVVICKMVSPVDDSSVFGLSVKWNSPVQLAQGKNLTRFRVDIYDLNNIPISSSTRFLTEEEQMAYKTSNIPIPFSTFIRTRPVKQPDGLDNGNYYLLVHAFAEPSVSSLPPNPYKFYVDTSVLPTCDVSWSEWGSCECSERNRTRVCEDPFETGIFCDDDEMGVQKERCECPLFSSTQIAAMAAGVVILLVIIIAIMWKLTNSKREDKVEETAPISIIRDNDISTGFGFKTPITVSIPTSRFGDYELSRDDLGVQLDQLLGSGAQGSVYRGQLRRDKNKWIDVAVKTPKFGDMTNSPQNEAARESFFKEIEFTIDVQGKKGHPNILEIMGCCTLHEPYYLVTPFMKYGDLQGFLRKCQKLKDQQDLEDPTYRLTQVVQLNILRQIAKGMEFLSGLKYYMGDLAASNILVGDHLVCKVADFGLGYDLYLTDGDINREPEAGFKFRPRWVSLETFQSRGAKVNLKSDVWSFGIVMFEVFTFGEVPYSQKWTNRFLLEQLTQGYRLESPDECSDRVYNIMLKCWLADPQMRPTFSDLVKQLGITIDALTHKASVDANYIDDLLTSDASGISNINFELDTVFEEDDDTQPKEKGDNAQMKKGEHVYANQKRVKMIQSKSNSSESEDTIRNINTEGKKRPPKPCPRVPTPANTKNTLHRQKAVQENSDGMDNPHEPQFDTHGSDNSDTKHSFQSEEIDINDFHSFKRFKDDEVLTNEDDV